MSDFDKIYDVLMSIKKEQGEQTAKQQSMHDGIEKLNGKVDKQNGRIGKLEGWRNMLTGAWLLFVLILTIVLKYWG